MWAKGKEGARRTAEKGSVCGVTLLATCNHTVAVFAYTHLRMRIISLNVSSLPCRTSNARHAAQKSAALRRKGGGVGGGGWGARRQGVLQCTWAAGKVVLGMAIRCRCGTDRHASHQV